MTRLKIASVAFLAMAAIGVVGVFTVGSRRSDAPGSASHESAAAQAPPRVDEPEPAAKPAARVGRVDPKRGALRIAKLKHAGDWNVAPRAIPNLMGVLRRPPFGFDVILEQREIFPRDPNLIYYPLIYMHGRAAFSFPKEDLEALRRHLGPGGGTLFADAACGNPAFDAAFRRFAAGLLPDHKLEPIPHDDDLYTEKVGFDLSDCEYTKAAGVGRGLPQLEGIKVNGRWAVIYSKFGMGCSLARQSGPDCKGYTYVSAVKIGANIVIYSSLP
jgi:hypothetical protein